MSQNEFKECHHMKDDGQKCHSPAMRGTSYCYFHARDRRRQFRRTRNGDVRLEIPSLQTRDDIVKALDQIMHALASAQITSRRASAMLYAVQMAQKELGKGVVPGMNLAELLGPISRLATGSAQNASSPVSYKLNPKS